MAPKLALPALALLLTACTTTTPTTPVSDEPQRRGIAGEWTLKADDSILSCRFVIDPGGGRGEGRATDFGCIDLDGFAGFIRRWERRDGRILFYRFAQDRPVARVRLVGRNELRGRLVPSGREITLTRPQARCLGLST
ncbi:MAG: hypothetical protein AAFW98_00645 [Pseudomonadota bacterium]